MEKKPLWKICKYYILILYSLISFLKSIYGNKFVAILGAMGQPGNTVKILTDKGTQLGVYKVLDSITGQVLKSIKNVKGNAVYDLYLFDKKL